MYLCVLCVYMYMYVYVYVCVHFYMCVHVLAGANSTSFACSKHAVYGTGSAKMVTNGCTCYYGNQ